MANTRRLVSISVHVKILFYYIVESDGEIVTENYLNKKKETKNARSYDDLYSVSV